MPELDGIPRFSKEEAQLEQFYLKKIINKYTFRTYFSLLILGMDSMVNMLIHFSDKDKNIAEVYTAVISFLSFLLIVFQVLFKPFQKRPKILKRILCFIIFNKISKRVFQFWVYHINGQENKREQIVIELVIMQTLIGLFMTNVGIFYLRD